MKITLLLLLLPALGASAAGLEGLLPLMVDQPGWEAEKADGADMSASGVHAVTVFRTYQDGDRRFEVSILVGTQASASWMPDYKEGWRMQTPEGVMEVRRIKGFLVWDSFVSEEASGGIIVLLQETQAENGAILAISYEGVGRDEAMTLAQRFNWARMKTEVGKLN
jgi:hypothetical protein